MDSFLSCFGQVYFFFARARAHTRSSLVIIAAIFCAISSPAFSAPVSLDAKQQVLMEKANDAKTQVSLPAIEALGYAASPAAIPGLAQIFKTSKNNLVRRYVVDALGQIRHADAYPTLEAAMKDPDLQIRQSASAALSLLGTAKAQALLAASAETEKSPAVRAHLAHHLKLVRTKEADKALEKLQKDKDPRVKRLADDAVQEHKDNTAMKAKKSGVK